MIVPYVELSVARQAHQKGIVILALALRFVICHPFLIAPSHIGHGKRPFAHTHLAVKLVRCPQPIFAYSIRKHIFLPSFVKVYLEEIVALYDGVPSLVSLMPCPTRVRCDPSRAYSLLAFQRSVRHRATSLRSAVLLNYSRARLHNLEDVHAYITFSLSATELMLFLVMVPDMGSFWRIMSSF